MHVLYFNIMTLSYVMIYCYTDVHMHLNQGLFRLNGGCGYVLKPKVMRWVNPEVDFDPRITTPHPDVNPINLEIEVHTSICMYI